MGIALKNVNARIKAFFGAISGLYIDSEYGKGTTVYLNLYDALVDQGINITDDEIEGADDDGAEDVISEASGPLSGVRG